MRRAVVAALGAVVLVSTIVVSGPAQLAGATVPAGFVDDLVATVGAPTALAFTPDGRMLVTTQPGRLRVVENGTLLATPALDISGRTCSNSERGMLGVAVDPDFVNNQSIFLYYTADVAGTCFDRVSRFTLGANNVVSQTSEAVLIDRVPSTAGNHNAGDLAFGKDGFLYISIGDGGCDYDATSQCAANNQASRDEFILLGKVLRITRTGGIPASNPFQGSQSGRCNLTGRTTMARCQETYAWGFRNPFRFAMDPNAAGTRVFVNDVGQATWEEIDTLQSGADYGWNVREGHCVTGSTTNCGAPPAGMTNPIFDYSHATGCGSITGGAFVPDGLWPGFDGAYLYGDYVCGKVFKLVNNGGTYSSSNFLTNLGANSAVHLQFGPYNSTQALYYTSYQGGGQVRRVRLAGGTNPPVAAISATPTGGPVPLNVAFNGSGSTDPDPGDSIASYQWDFGDGSTLTTSGPTTSHSYTTAGNRTASLVVVDQGGNPSPPTTITIFAGDNAPAPVIDSPAASATFRVGNDYVLHAHATDAEDGTLPDSSLSWTILKHHLTHTHPFLGPVSGNDITITAPPPEDAAAVANSYLELILTATHSVGATTTIHQNFQPHKVPLTFHTSPTGLKVTAAGTTQVAPKTITSWDGWVIGIGAPDQAKAGKNYVFVSWSDGGTRNHNITTPSTAKTYTATFRRRLV